MTNSAQLKDGKGKYEKLPICPVCEKKVHTEENDVNFEYWEFDDRGNFVHESCTLDGGQE